jgi:hypothetical protein
MAKRIKQFAEDLVYTPPARPAPINVVAVWAPDRDEFEYIWRHRPPEDLTREIRTRLARQVANILMEKCAPFVEMRTESGLPSYRLEVFLNDRGAYENWLPSERREGRQEGAKAVIEMLPYGMELGATYE